MKKIKLGLFPKVVIAIVVGALLGLILPDVAIRILKTFNVLFAQLLKFVVPLLVLGLVTPSIANLGRGAGKMLITVMLIAYCSTVFGALFSYGVSSSIFPMYLEPGELATSAVAEKEFLPYIDLKIPPICDIMTALVLSFVVGVGIIFTGATGLGKTHLSLAIAQAVINKGYNVVYGAAQRLFSNIEREHFGRSKDPDGTTEDMLAECDLLILDDLGAEFTNNFTIAKVFLKLVEFSVK